MAINRTEEFFALASKNLSPPPPNDTKTTANNVRNRINPIKEKNEGPVDSPSTECTAFMDEAYSIFGNIREAMEMANSILSIDNLHKIQTIISLCNERLHSLKIVRQQASQDREHNQRSWISLFAPQGEEEKDQIDELEDCVLNHLQQSINKVALVLEEFEESERQRLSSNIFVRKRSKIGARLLENVNHAPTTTTTTFLANAQKGSDKSFGVKDDQQMRMLMEENESILKANSEMSESIDQTQTYLKEISELQNSLQNHILYQASQIDKVYEDSIISHGNVKKANYHLSRAEKKQSTSVTFFLWFVLLSSFFILFLHFISD